MPQFYRLLLFCAFLQPVYLLAQVTANPTSGCAPLVGVTFTGIPGSTNILWNFADGTTSSILNPTHTFNAPGTYNVTYSATVNGNPVNHSIQIKVFGKPSPAFTANPPTNGCAPLSVTFQDQSAGGGGVPVTKWEWAFGDGGVGNTANPAYIYTLKGQFDVSLKITDQNGCDSSIVLKTLVKVSQKPTLNLTTSPDPAAACKPPLAVSFGTAGTASNSPLTTALTYQWNFGNGNSSVLASPPVQTYTAQGTYTVTLKVTDDNACSDSVKRIVSINNPFASFSVNDTVCKTVTFDPSGSTPGTLLWNYGDGSQGASNFHTYASGGYYDVKLTVSNAGCQDDTTIKIFVEDPLANFTITPTYTCQLPQTVNIINTSAPGSTYQWNFGITATNYSVTPSTSTLQSPVLTVIHLDTNRYTVNKEDYVLNISLVVTTKHGCIAQKTINLKDTIYLPTARFMPDTVQGCAPLTVFFSDSSKSKEPIVNWHYDFGDGNSQNPSAQNPSHTYTQPGVYYPRLIIRNSKGCIDTSYTIKIVVGKAPRPDFTALPSAVCAGDSVKLTDLTTDPVDIWQFKGDKGFFFSHCPGDNNPAWPFRNQTGVQDVKMIACYRGCCDSISKPVTVNGPLVKARTKMDCDSPFVYTFLGEFQDATNWTWDFGDGTVIANSIQDSVVHTYTLSGNYKMIVTAFNPGTGCKPWSDTVNVLVRDIKAAITASLTVCSQVPIGYSAVNSKDVSPACGGYIWLWEDGSHPDILTTPSVSHNFSPGIHKIKLVVRDTNYCHDTATFTVKAYGITPLFTSNKQAICTLDSVKFTNQSLADTTIVKYTWNFGDGGTSNLVNPSHTYTTTSQAITTYTVRLTVEDALGCTKTYTKVIAVSRPSALFSYLTKSNICAGDSVKLSANTSYPNMTWNFGDGSTALNLPNPGHIYANAGTYTLNLTVTDTAGCRDSRTNSIPVNVQDKPTAIITSPADTAANICYPYQGIFTDSSIASVFGSRVWDLGTGQPVNNSLKTVGINYPLPGVYTIKLIVTTTFGCTDTTTKQLLVKGPLADFDILTSDTICKGQSLSFNIKDTTDVFTWHWDFGDGSDTTAVNPITHQYNFYPPGGTTNVTLVFWSADSSCAATRTKPVYIYEVIAGFDRNNETTVSDTAHCQGLPDIFTNQSINGDTYAWDFGDGTKAGAVSPASHTYKNPGTYEVTLSIHNKVTGCVDTLRKKMVIHPLPVALVKGDSLCTGDTTQLFASGGLSYSWIPDTYLSSSSVSNPMAWPPQTMSYEIIVTSQEGCRDTTSATIYVQQPPPSVVWDTTVVIGEKVPLFAPAGPGFVYSWTPPRDLSCSACPAPIATPTVDTQYKVTVTDVMGCFTVESIFDIKIKPLSSIDVPTAFTPNGDGTNDVVYVDGWGIKKLLEFKIYNRWGELVFESNDLSIGWDGTFRGVPQNMETYVYQVTAETYIDEKPITKKGYIKLLR